MPSHPQDRMGASQQSQYPNLTKLSNPPSSGSGQFRDPAVLSMMSSSPDTASIAQDLWGRPPPGFPPPGFGNWSQPQSVLRGPSSVL
jgi:hypothetical protein